MKKGKNGFNAISPKLKSLIPKLKKGERVKFQMLTGVPNPEPDPRERAKQGEVLYSRRNLLTNFRIYDPYQEEVKDENGEVVDYIGGYVDIGCVERWLGDSPDKFRLFMPGVTGAVLHNRAFGGTFELLGGNQADEELFEILWLSPEREGSPCADAGFEVIFRLVDERAGVRQSVNKLDNLKRAIEISASLTEEEVRDIMAALNQPTYQDTEVLMSKFKDYAISNVDAFLKTYDSKETPIKGTIRKAMDAKVLEYELKSGDVRVGGAVVANIKVDNLQSFAPSFAQWIASATNGQDVYQNIKNQMVKKEEVA